MRLLTVYTGFAWTMRVTGLMALALLIVGSLLVKPFLPPKRKPFFSGLFEGLKDMRLSLLIASSCAMYMGYVHHTISRGVGFVAPELT
jgi:hypothetical protein